MLAKFKSTKCVLSNVNLPAKKAICCIIGSTITVVSIYGGYSIINNSTLKKFVDSRGHKISITERILENINIGCGIIVSPICMILITRDMFRTLKYGNDFCSVIRETMRYSAWTPVFIFSISLATLLILKRYADFKEEIAKNDF